MTTFAQFDKAFARVAAYAVLKDGARVAKISIKFPADGAGRLYAYVHWLGTEMVRGSAGGYGYDKRTAAVANAISKIDRQEDSTGTSLFDMVAFDAFCKALEKDDGAYFDRKLTDAGFTVIQAI